MDISLALKRFNSLQNNTKKSDSIWKPANGKSQIRIVPYKFNKDIPFIELYFHYNINNKTYLSPMSFGRPDPIVEFAEKLKGQVILMIGKRVKRWSQNFVLLYL